MPSEKIVLESKLGCRQVRTHETHPTQIHSTKVHAAGDPIQHRVGQRQVHAPIEQGRQSVDKFD